MGCIYKHLETSLQVVYTNTQKYQYMLYIQTPKNIIIGCIQEHPKTSIYVVYTNT